MAPGQHWDQASRRHGADRNQMLGEAAVSKETASAGALLGRRDPNVVWSIEQAEGVGKAVEASAKRCWQRLDLVGRFTCQVPDSGDVFPKRDAVVGDCVKSRTQPSACVHSMTMRGALTASSANARSILSPTRPAMARYAAA